MPVLNGIDISNYQRGLDVRTIKADFVIVKASEGIGYEDPSCHTFTKAALSSKKKLGLYHFARPGKENPAARLEMPLVGERNRQKGFVFPVGCIAHKQRRSRSWR